MTVCYAFLLNAFVLAQTQIEKHMEELPLPTKTGYTWKGHRR